MKRILVIIVLSMAFLMAITGCYVNVKPGYAGIKVYLYGNGKGMNVVPLGIGRHGYGVYEEIYTYPTFQRVYPFTQSTSEGSPIDEAFYFQTKEGIKCNVDIGIQASANFDKVTKLFETYQEDTFEEIIKKFLRNDVRDLLIKEAATLTVEQLYGESKITLLRNVENSLTEQAEINGINVTSVSFLSDIRFPEEIEAAIIGKIQATQDAMKRENEVAKAKAEALIKVVNAEAEAAANKAKMASLTPQLLQYEALQNQKMAIEKWDGKTMPQTIVGQGTPFNIPLFLDNK